MRSQLFDVEVACVADCGGGGPNTPQPALFRSAMYPSTRPVRDDMRARITQSVPRLGALARRHEGDLDAAESRSDLHLP